MEDARVTKMAGTNEIHERVHRTQPRYVKLHETSKSQYSTLVVVQLEQQLIGVVLELGMPTLDGTLVKLGMPEHPMAVPTPALFFGRHRLAGSLIGGIAEMQEMLDFCAERHDVRPEIEVIAPDYINEAYEWMLVSDVRYRFVIDTQSLRA